MKKKITALLTIMCLIIVATSLTGCGGKTSSKESLGRAAVCYVIAPTANSQGLNFNSPLVQDTIYDTVLNYGYISVMVVDGNPELVAADSYDIDAQYKKASKEKLKTDARTKTTNLITYMENQIANDPQVDYLEGLRMAVRSLSSLKGYDSKTIILIGTALSTQGTLNFQNNLLSAEPDAVLDLLEEKNEIPDFASITVVSQQMGDVASPQQKLSETQKKRLQEIWAGIVERGGGTFVYNDIMANPVATGTTYPEVDPIELVHHLYLLVFGFILFLKMFCKIRLCIIIANDSIKTPNLVTSVFYHFSYSLLFNSQRIICNKTNQATTKRSHYRNSHAKNS